MSSQSEQKELQQETYVVQTAMASAESRFQRPRDLQEDVVDLRAGTPSPATRAQIDKDTEIQQLKIKVLVLQTKTDFQQRSLDQVYRELIGIREQLHRQDQIIDRLERTNQLQQQALAFHCPGMMPRIHISASSTDVGCNSVPSALRPVTSPNHFLSVPSTADFRPSHPTSSMISLLELDAVQSPNIEVAQQLSAGINPLAINPPHTSRAIIYDSHAEAEEEVSNLPVSE